jgi:hypothetical protein
MIKIMTNDQAPITRKEIITNYQITITKGEDNLGLRLINCNLVIGNFSHKGI